MGPEDCREQCCDVIMLTVNGHAFIGDQVHVNESLYRRQNGVFFVVTSICTDDALHRE